jgi:hypothetical protein
VPLDTRAATFGLTLNRVGVVITDNYRMIGN